MRIFNIRGQVIDRKSGGGVAGVRVEAWDQDTVFHDLLGIQHTDAQGRFTITFDERYCGDYGGDQLPDLFFKVFHGQMLLVSTEKSVRWNVAAGNTNALIPVDAPPDAPRSMPTSTEVRLDELGESVAQAAWNMQQELARYPASLGAFMLDDLELSIPVRMRTDELGQVLATVMDTEQPGALVGQVRLRVRPTPGLVPAPPSSASAQPLEALGVLGPVALQKLHAHRIFSVGDLVRVAQAPEGRAALEHLDLGSSLEAVLARAAVLSLPTVPQTVSEKLLELGIQSPGHFIEQDAGQLSRRLTEKLRQPISASAVESWQRAAQPPLALLGGVPSK